MNHVPLARLVKVPYLTALLFGGLFLSQNSQAAFLSSLRPSNPSLTEAQIAKKKTQLTQKLGRLENTLSKAQKNHEPHDLNKANIRISGTQTQLKALANGNATQYKQAQLQTKADLQKAKADQQKYMNRKYSKFGTLGVTDVLKQKYHEYQSTRYQNKANAVGHFMK